LGLARPSEAAFLQESSVIDPADDDRDELPSDAEDGPPDIDEEEDGLPANGEEAEEEEEEGADVAVAPTNVPADDPTALPSPQAVLTPPNPPTAAHMGSLKVVELKEHLAWRGLLGNIRQEGGAHWSPAASNSRRYAAANPSGDGCSRACSCPLATAKVGGSRPRPH